MKKIILLFAFGVIVIGAIKAQTSCPIDTNGLYNRMIAVFGETSHELSGVDTAGYGIFYPLQNDTVNLFGLRFYATLVSTQNDSVPVAINIYSSNSTQLPLVLLATDTVIVDTIAAIPPDIFSLARVAEFGTPVILTDTFIIVVEAASDSIVRIDFAYEFLSRGKFNPNGTWGDLSDSIAGFPTQSPHFEPIWQIDANADFTIDGSSSDTFYACVGQSLTFNNTGNYAYFQFDYNYSNVDPDGTFPFYWYFGDSTKSSSQDSTFKTYSAPGNYFAVLIDSVESSTDPTMFCIDIDTVLVIVEVPPTISNFGYTSADTSLTVSFTDTSSANSQTYSWNFGDGDTSALQNPSHGYVSTGSYFVTHYVYNWCGVDSISDTVVVTCDTLPTTSFTYMHIGGANFQFTNTSTNAGSYNWDFGDASNSSLKDPIHAYASLNTYTVILTATNACGSTMDTMTVVHDGINEINLDQLIQVYPNPSEGVISIESAYLSGQDYVEIKVENILGQSVYRQNSNHLASKISIDLGNYQPGLYTISIYVKDGHYSTRIMVK